MPASKRATEETSKTATKPAVGVTVKAAAKVTAKPGGKANIKTVSKVAEEATPVPADISGHASATRPVASTRKPSKTALSPSEVTPLALLTPSKPARRRRSGAAKPRKLKGATTTWPFPTGSRP